MRGERALRNIITNIILQIVLTISGLFISRLILVFYGSSVNGMVSSISQFISYAALIEMGIGNATIIALYKPLAEKDSNCVNSILTASKRMYVKSGIIYVVIIGVLAVFYPFLVHEQIEYTYAFWMVLCIGSINAIDYFIIGKYKVFLIAEQKYYVLNLVKIFATVLLIIGSYILLYSGGSLLLVKGVAVITHLIEAVLIYFYIHIRYSYLNYHFKKVCKIDQRWNAMVCQMCSTVVYNTDLVVLTLCLPGRDLSEISVYTVYAMAAAMISNLVGTLSQGINASFGDMFAKNEKETIYRMFARYEFAFFIVLFVLYTSCAILITPFVHCYTQSVKEVNYIRYGVGILFTLNGLTAQLKEVSGVIINAVGRYREVQRYALEEAIINIIISILLVKVYGILGVLVGTLVSHIVMDIRFIIYVNQNLVRGTIKQTIKRIATNTLIAVVVITLGLRYIELSNSWVMWIIQAICVSVISGSVFILINGYIEFSLMKDIIKILINIFKRIASLGENK